MRFRERSGEGHLSGRTARWKPGDQSPAEADDRRRSRDARGAAGHARHHRILADAAGSVLGGTGPGGGRLSRGPVEAGRLGNQASVAPLARRASGPAHHAAARAARSTLRRARELRPDRLARVDRAAAHRRARRDGAREAAPPARASRRKRVLLPEPPTRRSGPDARHVAAGGRGVQHAADRLPAALCAAGLPRHARGDARGVEPQGAERTGGVPAAPRAAVRRLRGVPARNRGIADNRPAVATSPRGPEAARVDRTRRALPTAGKGSVTSFLPTPETSPIAQLALPLASRVGAGYYACGTACLVSPGIAIAASHVVEEHWGRHEKGPLEGDALGDFNLLALQTLNAGRGRVLRSEEHTSELQSQSNLVCRLLLEKKKKN